MYKVKHWLQLIIFDALAVFFMILAIATGWLPGPGGIPLFLIGLGLLAINHEWAKRYIDLLKEYADKLGDLIFIPRLRVFFDVLAPILLTAGGYFLYRHSAVWMISLGLFLFGMGLVTFFGNRNRWKQLISRLKHKQ